jgi:hypothetical protein
VFFRQRELEVDGGQNGEHVGLQNRDQQFKEGEGNAKQDCSDTENCHPEFEYRMKKCVEEKNNTNRK